MHWPAVIEKRRRERQNRTAFVFLLETPATGAFVLPAGARLALSSSAGAAAGTEVATITGTSTRTIESPVLAAGELYIVDYVERGAELTPAAGFDVFLDIGLGRYSKIAEGA